MKKGYADTPYGQIHYVVAGQGAPVVLIAPSKRSSRVHADLIPLLARRYRVLSPDNFGYGNSDPLPPDATIDMLAEGAMAALDAIGEKKAHFYGLHTGNKIAAAIAARWPDRVGKLVLAGHSHSLIPDQARRNAVIGDLVKDFLKSESIADDARRELKAWATLFRRIDAVWWDDTLFADGDTAARIALAKRVILDYIQSADSTVGLYHANFSYDLGDAMTRVQAPTLILEIATPAEDRDYGRQAEHVQRLIPGAYVATLHEAEGHTHTLEHRAADVARILTEFFA
ncbi:MAG TPA: alpha/beta hydrolase [Bordetella sp.]|nr:alpha/beta hydrolase [Bordetella sp.]